MKISVHVLEFVMYVWVCICKAVQVCELCLCVSIYCSCVCMYVPSMTHLLSLAVVSEVVCQSHWQESGGGEWTVSTE